MSITMPLHKWQRELVFKVVNGHQLKISILPPLKICYEKAPVLILTSGGGWFVQSAVRVLDIFRGAVEKLREHGIAVAITDYRVIRDFPDITFADECADVLDAIAYLREYADVLGLDEEKMIVGGHSAGGHISMLLANAPHSIFPTTRDASGLKYLACVSFSGPAFLNSMEEYPAPLGADFSYIFLNQCYNEEQAKQWSAYSYLSANSPDTLMIHGESDTVVNLEISQITIRKAKAVGAKFDLITASNRGHEWEIIDPAEPAGMDFSTVQNMIVAWILNKVR